MTDVVEKRLCVECGKIKPLRFFYRNDRVEVLSCGSKQVVYRREYFRPECCVCTRLRRQRNKLAKRGRFLKLRDTDTPPNSKSPRIEICPLQIDSCQTHAC
jgi:hypothetical protein